MPNRDPQNPSAIADLRKSYELAELVESAALDDPNNQFEQWLAEAIAAKVPEPNAMTLATVGSDLRPSTRIVLIKGLDARGPVWFTNYQSRKGIEVAGNPYAALQFHWVDMERTVRIEGVAEKISAEESDAYYHSRPLGSRISAWASPQSDVVASRSVLEASEAEFVAIGRPGESQRCREHGSEGNLYRRLRFLWQAWSSHPEIPLGLRTLLE